MQITIRKLRNLMPPLLWAVLIFVISSIPASPFIKIQTQPKSLILRFLLSDAVGHIIMFGILSFLLGRSLRKSFPLISKRNLILWAFLVSSLLALANEVYQQLIISGRTFEIEDLIWGLVGMGAAVGYLFITLPKTMRKPHSIP